MIKLYDTLSDILGKDSGEIVLLPSRCEDQYLARDACNASLTLVERILGDFKADPRRVSVNLTGKTVTDRFVTFCGVVRPNLSKDSYSRWSHTGHFQARILHFGCQTWCIIYAH